jgi:hypothetical protein
METSTINNRTIKISFNKETHIYRGELDIEKVKNYIDAAFNKKKFPADYRLQYEDEDGDQITVSCDEDL